MNVLEFNNVSFTYFSENGETKAVDNISFNVKNGEFVAILGPSGSGKTTILSLISGLLSPTNGEVVVNNIVNSAKDLQNNKNVVKMLFLKLKRNKRRVNELKSETGYMFQKDHLFEWRSVMQNVLLGIEIQKKSFTKQAKKEFFKKNKHMSFFKRLCSQKKFIKQYFKEKREYANVLLKKYGLWEFRKKYPSQLSGGMRQRVALIRTLALKPNILLLDEPFSALDYQTRLNLCDDVSKIIKNENKTTVLVTHDITEALSMANKVIVLTKRPAKVKNIHVIDIDANMTPLQKRENGAFLKYFDTIWKEIQSDDNI